jgi:dTDP-4-dehydrorhamnose 3,5-epimerase-like enzyme
LNNFIRTDRVRTIIKHLTTRSSGGRNIGLWTETGCFHGWYLLSDNCGLIYSSRRVWPDYMGESGGER